MARKEFQKSYQDRTNFGRIIGFIVGKQKVCVGGGGGGGERERERRTEEERSHCICSQAGLNRTQRGGLESGLDVAFWGGAR